jgi:hypothetical protein
MSLSRLRRVSRTSSRSGAGCRVTHLRVWQSEDTDKPTGPFVVGKLARDGVEAPTFGQGVSTYRNSCIVWFASRLRQGTRPAAGGADIWQTSERNIAHESPLRHGKTMDALDKQNRMKSNNACSSSKAVEWPPFPSFTRPRQAERSPFSCQR